MVEEQSVLGEEDSMLVLVYATYPSREAAITAGKSLIEAHLAGCINILPNMTALYRWKGAFETADEAVLIAKLPERLSQRAIAHIVEYHPYEVPAVLVIPVVAGAEKYLGWIEREVRGE